MIKLFLEFLSLLQCFSIVCVWRYGFSCPYVSTIWFHLLSILQEILQSWLRTTPFLVSPPCHGFPCHCLLSSICLIQSSWRLREGTTCYHIIFQQEHRHSEELNPLFLCHHSQNMVILELNPWSSDPMWRQTIHSTYLLRRIFLWLYLSSSMMQPKGSWRAVWKHLAPCREPTIRRIPSWIYITWIEGA